MKVFNRIKSASEKGWYQIEVKGEHYALTQDEKEVVQIIDAEAIESINADFNLVIGEAGMLIDADHLSHDDDEKTEAYGWLMQTRINKAGELEGKIEWSDIGKMAVDNKRYKFFSTEYAEHDLQDLGDGKIRPLRISGLALTNRPNNEGGKPISNRVKGEPSGTEESINNNNMKNIAEQLGLPAEASQEEILAVIAEMQSKITEMEDQIKNTKAKEEDEEAEKILNRYSGRFAPAARAAWKAQLLTNRAGTEELLKSLPQANSSIQKVSGVHNRRTAGIPDPVVSSAEEESNDAQQRKLISGIKIKNCCSNTDAYKMAKHERPDLF